MDALAHSIRKWFIADLPPHLVATVKYGTVEVYERPYSLYQFLAMTKTHPLPAMNGQARQNAIYARSRLIHSIHFMYNKVPVIKHTDHGETKTLQDLPPLFATYSYTRMYAFTYGLNVVYTGLTYGISNENTFVFYKYLFDDNINRFTMYGKSFNMVNAGRA